MSTVSVRRKHGTCLFRFREHCPFRKFRKNRYEVTGASSAGAAVCYNDLGENPVSATSNRPVSTIYAETLPPVPTYQPAFLPHLPQGPVEMDMELVPAPPSNIPVLSLHPTSGLVLKPPNQQRHRSSGTPHEASMELDSGIDPETGERALG